MRSTLGMHQYQKPPFEPQARYVAARPLKWGNNVSGYVTIPAAQEDTLETTQPLDFEHMQPPVDATVVARLYRTGFLAMLLTDDGQPLLKDEHTTEDSMSGRHPVSELAKDWPAEKLAAVEQRKAELREEMEKAESSGAICPRCGRQFKSSHVPFFHEQSCSRKDAA